ncbi:FAA hydrolase family protein [Burkholderia glumae]|uniref:fumarylacetoacetate hydrolase family protein n=1 Tax=Burkholderia glumae TaxID=337 RepID=UPI002151E0B1|nr:fumarylacetoacetate hydrolase family protein [Burkholderia glumae]UVS84069.1 FAA hydrolase family protein [Burkholderia glumae]
MKFARYGQPGHEKPALVDQDGKLRDLSGVIADITPATLDAGALDKLRALDVTSLPVVAGSPRYGCPINGIGKFLAIGLNYSDHAAETGMPVPKEPVVFTKAISCIQGPNDPVMLPRGSEKTDWEVELGVVIGRVTRYVERDQALEHVAGYCTINDVSERHFQLERTPQWDKGKGCDTFGPIGPWLVTRDEVPDAQNLAMWLEVNGKRMQNGSTKTMIFDVAEIVSHLSQFMTLMPGDVITTGTPPGVGMAMNPPQFLRAGDVIRLGIEGLGEQQQTVVPFKL